MEGKYNGGNKIETIHQGRWTKKITTPDGIVLYKDAQNNVAVQSPDGAWHVTNPRGEYASSSRELETGSADRQMVARAAPARKS
ncbi:hypothetical protein, partial [Pseudomonas aeruginosa]